MPTQKPTTVDQYISQASSSAQDKLRELRSCLQKAAPHAKELLKWGKPAFEAEYILFVYAGFKNHISFHPTLEVITAFKDELTAYETSANTVQFALDQPLPLELISNMAAFRVEQSKQGLTWR